MYRKELDGMLSILVLLTLTTSFFAISKSPTSKYASWAIVSILTVWSVGILSLGLFVKARLAKYSIPVAWTLTVISGLAILSLYGSWLTFYLIPISLFFGYIKLKVDSNKKWIMIPIVLNLIFCSVLASFIVSAGLWR